MLKPIPRSILAHSVTLKIATGTDEWQNPTYRTATVSHVYLEQNLAFRKTTDNTERTRRGTLFVDARLSHPALNWDALADQSEQHGAPMVVECGTRVYTVDGVETLFDDSGAIHHYEVGLV